MRAFKIAISVVLLGILALGLAYPLLSVFRVSLTGETGAPALSVYMRVFANGYFMRALTETVLFCFVTSVIATFWAVPVAWRIGRGRHGAHLLQALSQINFAFAGIIYGMLMIVLMGNVGALALAEAWLLGTEVTRGLAFTAFGLGITYLSFQIPRSALILAEAVAKMDPGLLAGASGGLSGGVADPAPGADRGGGILLPAGHGVFRAGTADRALDHDLSCGDLPRIHRFSEFRQRRRHGCAFAGGGPRPGGGDAVRSRETDAETGAMKRAPPRERGER